MADQKSGSVGVRKAFHFQFITTPTADTPGTTLLLHFDSKRYIFGEITEGTQRACIQRGIGLKKVRGMFLAGKTHWNNGGLIGMILTLADSQQSEVDEETKRRPRLNIFAGPMQLHQLACARRFVFRTGMPLSVHEVDLQKNKGNPELILQDDNIRVWALATHGVESGEQETTTSQEHLNQEQSLKNEVVNNMFDSTWRRDQLFPAKLKDVKLPALVWVRDPSTKSLTTYPVQDLSKTPLSPDDDVLVRHPWPASTVEELSSTSGLPRDVAMSYVVKGPAQRGSFDAKRAKELGLTPGPIYRDLVSGQSVTLGDGTVITPEMVISPTRPGRGVAIFDVPSESHLGDLEQQLTNRQDDLFQGIEAAIWMTRGKVMQSRRFEAVLRSLKDLKHIISDPQLGTNYIAQDSSSLASGRLAQIAPALFAVPHFDNTKAYRPTSEAFRPQYEIPTSSSEVVVAKRGLKVQIEPKFSLDENEVPRKLDDNSFATAIEPEVKTLASSELSTSAKSGFVPGAELDEPEVVTLGTGSAAPSKYRNVSAVLLRMPNGVGNYLFDAGEGTLGQLQRMYTAAQLDDILFSLRAIWISHLHADHHLGTVTVLRSVYKTVERLSGTDRARPSPPYLISEKNMIDYVNEYQSVLGLPTGSICRPISCDPRAGLSLDGEPFDMGQQDSQIKEWRTVKVSHCHGAQAVSVTFKNGFKFSYSGDCRPNEAFCSIGADSDVLVHEATFDDGMEGDAQAKKHSTTGEAVGVALGMRAKNLILTHFSQRYQKLPVLSSVKMPQRVSEEEMLDDEDAEVGHGAAQLNGDESEEIQALEPSASASPWTEPEAARELPIAVAFDLMRIRVSQIKHMKKIFPAISKMFELEEARRDNARREIAEQHRLMLEGRKAVRDEAGVKNREKMAAKNKAKQMEDNTVIKKNKNKRRTGVGDLDTQTPVNGHAGASDVSAKSSRADDGENGAGSSDTITKSVQTHEGEDIRMQNHQEGGDEGNPLKRRKTE